jgi:hypothetical protein
MKINTEQQPLKVLRELTKVRLDVQEVTFPEPSGEPFLDQQVQQMC